MRQQGPHSAVGAYPAREQLMTCHLSSLFHLGYLPILSSPVFTLKEEYKRLVFPQLLRVLTSPPHTSVKQLPIPLRIRGLQAAQQCSGKPGAGCGAARKPVSLPLNVLMRGMDFVRRACLAVGAGSAFLTNGAQSWGPAQRHTVVPSEPTDPCQGVCEERLLVTGSVAELNPTW